MGARAVLWMIEGYRVAISPLLPPTCRYAPSCSEYAVVAISRFGVGRGSWLALRRLLRCGPWHRGGYDPVPELRPEKSVQSEPSVIARPTERVTEPELEHQL